MRNIDLKDFVEKVKENYFAAKLHLEAESKIKSMTIERPPQTVEDFLSRFFYRFFIKEFNWSLKMTVKQTAVAQRLLADPKFAAGLRSGLRKRAVNDEMDEGDLVKAVVETIVQDSLADRFVTPRFMFGLVFFNEVRRRQVLFGLLCHELIQDGIDVYCAE